MARPKKPKLDDLIRVRVTAALKAAGHRNHGTGKVFTKNLRAWLAKKPVGRPPKRVVVHDLKLLWQMAKNHRRLEEVARVADSLAPFDRESADKIYFQLEEIRLAQWHAVKSARGEAEEEGK